MRRLASALLLLLALAATACGGGKHGSSGDAGPRAIDAHTGPPPIDAHTGDLAAGDVLTGAGTMQGGTMKMQVEIGNGVKPTPASGGTVTVQPGSSSSP